MKFKYHFKGCFEFSWDETREAEEAGLIVGVDDDNADPRLIKKPTREQAVALLNKPQYIGTGLTATLVEILE
jgi:hypothetical protein